MKIAHLPRINTLSDEQMHLLEKRFGIQAREGYLKLDEAKAECLVHGLPCKGNQVSFDNLDDIERYKRRQD